MAGAAVLLGGGIGIGLALGRDPDATDAARNPAQAPLTALAAAQAKSGGPFVTSPEIEAAGRATPSHVVLRFWQLVQFGAAVPEIRTLFAPAVALDEAAFRRQLRAVRYLFAASKPYVVDEQRDGRIGRVFTLISTDGLRRSRGGTEEPFVFRTVKTGSGWRLADNAFVDAKHRAELGARPRGRP